MYIARLDNYEVHTHERGDGRYIVRKFDKKGITEYTVMLNPEWRGVRCSCPIVKFHRKEYCKHQALVEEALRLLTGKDDNASL